MLVPLSFLLCIEIGLGNELSSRENKDKILSQLYQFLYKRLKEQAKYEVASDKKGVKPVPYKIPGPFEPLPGRSHITNFWPLFPFSNQYSGGVDLDPSTTRHFGGDLNVPVPSWGMMDINGRFYNRIQDTTYKFGYHLAPVNMLGLKKNDLDDLMTDPFLLVNRANQPLIPIATVPKTFVPMSCKAPLCNPFTQNFAFGYEQDIGGWNGVESDIDIPIPISKYLAYNFPLSGNFYIHPDNLTITYGHNIHNIDPHLSLFAYQKYIGDFPEDVPDRTKREIGANQAKSKWEKFRLEEIPYKKTYYFFVDIANFIKLQRDQNEIKNVIVYRSKNKI